MFRATIKSLSVRFLVFIFLAGLFTGITQAQSPADKTRQAYHPTQLIAKPKQDAYRLPYGMQLKNKKRFSKNCLVRKNRATGRKNTSCRQPGRSEFELITVEVKNSNMSMEQAIDTMLDTGEYEYVEPDYLLHENAIPNDPLFGQQWGLNSAHGADPDINAPAAWDITTGNEDVVVAVLDSGVDYTHPDIADNIWVNSGEIPGDGIDNDLNGYVDDYHGIDTHNDDSDPMDDRGHGTHLAGIIAASGNNGIGISGVSWHTKIMALKFLNGQGSGSISNAIEAINYVIGMRQQGVNIKIINTSWGSRNYSQALNDVITTLADSDIVMMASAGNNGEDLELFKHYPASYDQPNILVVGMHGSLNHYIVSSNIGEAVVDISAPGENILSTALSGSASTCQDDNGDGYSLCTGTSMSTAFVSGVAALLQAQHPADTATELLQRIVRSGKPSFTIDRFVIPWTGKSATGDIVDSEAALNFEGLYASPHKIYIEHELPYQVQGATQLTQPLSLSSLADGYTTWSLSTGDNWISADQTNGGFSPGQQQDIDIEMESEFDFGLTKGSLEITESSASNVSFDIPVTIRTWLQTLDLDQQALQSPATEDEMGFAVAADGDLIVVSAPGEAVNAVTGGMVHIFRVDSAGQWQLEASLSASNAAPNNRFGSSVAVSGDKIVVGAPSSDLVAPGAGEAYVFHYHNGQWLEQQRFFDPVGVSNDRFGESVAIDADLIVIGAPQLAISYAPDAAQRRGSVHIYHYDGSQWQQQVKLSEPEPDLNTYIRFGADVDVSGSRIVVGAYHHPDRSLTSGRVYSYRSVAGQWQLEHVFEPPENNVEFFGYQVALSDNDLVISAPFARNQSGKRVGDIFTYRFDGNWQWTQRLSAPDIDAEEVFFGNSLDINGERIIVGVPNQDLRAINSGSVYLFHRVDSQWQPQGRLAPESVFGYLQLNYGRSVALSAGRAVVGSGLLTAVRMPTWGYVHEFDAPQTPGAFLETQIVNNLDASWRSVSLNHNYENMVAVCSVQSAENTVPIVVRMKQASQNSFSIKLQNPGDLSTVLPETVYCIVAEEGVWQLPDGNAFEARKYLSQATANNSSWVSDSGSFDYGHAYTNPVVFGQVMTENDPDWSAFWSAGSSRYRPASSTVLNTGKHVGEDPDRSRADETIGYMVFDSASSTLGPVNYQVALTADQIKHFGSNSNTVVTNLGVQPALAVVSQAGMDGNNGSWAVLEGDSALQNGQIKIAVDEDQVRDSERRHTTENVSFFIATGQIDVPLQSVGF